MRKLPLPPVLLILLLVCMAAACDGTFVNYLLGPYDRGGSGSVFPPANPRARYVAPTAIGSGDGSSWANAAGDLQEMIDYAADPGNNIDEIWVQAGIYTPTRRKDGSSNRLTDFENTFTLKEGVKIYGGFKGGEAVLAQRDWKKNSTTLSGDFNGDDPTTIDLSSFGLEENAYRVVWSEGLTPATVLDGFTIRGGCSNYHFYDGNFYLSDIRGGIYNDNSSPTLANLVIRGNMADSGGGITCTNGSSPTLTNVTITNNFAVYNGGGILCENGSSPTLTNVTITGNFTNFYGGGIYSDNTSPKLTNVVITGNAAQYGGGIHNSNSLSILTNVTISGNSTQRGGGIYNDGNSFLTIRNSIIWGNNAEYSGQNVENSVGSAPMYWNSLLEGSGGSGSGVWSSLGADNGGNIDADPQFVSYAIADDPYSPTPDGDFRLKVSPLSPAINAGDDSFVVGVTTDRDGNSRVLGSSVDMGAYEMVY